MPGPIITEAFTAEGELTNPTTHSKREMNMDRIDLFNMIKGRQSLPSLSSQSAILPLKDVIQGKKCKKEVKFSADVVMQQVVSEGDILQLKDLLAKHGNQIADVTDPNGVPPILRAILENQVESLKVLLAAGANLLAQDPEGWNAFHVASAMDDIISAKMILEAGCQHRGMTQSRNADGDRAIDLAESLEMARFLLHADLAEFRLNCSNMTSTTSDKACGYRVGEITFYMEKSEKEILRLVKDFYETHSNSMILNSTLNEVLKENTSYCSLLHLAATKNYSRLADYICTNFAPSLEVRDNRGWTALHTAAYNSNVDMVLLLVERGANIHTITRSYRKPSDLTEHKLILSIMEECQVH